MGAPIGFHGTGLAFPVRTDPAGRLRTAAGGEKVRQSIQLILATAPGERVMRQDFGCAIHDHVFEPNSPALHGVVAQQVRDALTRWEPRADVLDVAVEAPEEAPHCLLVRVDYRLRADNTRHNLVYPFVLTEGDDTGMEG